MDFHKPAAYKSINSSSVILENKEEENDLYNNVGYVVNELVETFKSFFLTNSNDI